MGKNSISKEMELILNNIKDQIVPASHEIDPKVDLFLKKLNSIIKSNNIFAKAVIGGSYAKNTFLKNDHDVDIFVKFNLKYKNEDISNLLENILRELGSSSLEKVHGSRDYFQLKHSNFQIEIVPVLNISSPEQAVNVTDVSPLHVDWVNNKCKNNLELKNDIRLAKKFCKAQKVYGAESYIQGISGHVLDILIIHYNGFINLINEVSKWDNISLNNPIIIDPEKRLKSIKDFNKSKISPLIVIDPIQHDRNAAAALGVKKLKKLVTSADKFLNNPTELFFFEKSIKEEIIEKQKNLVNDQKLIIVEFIPLKGKKDIIGSKVKKVFDFIKLNLNEFNIIDSNWEFKENIMYFILEKGILPDHYIRQGPPLKQKIHANSFKKKNKQFYEEKGVLYAKIKRDYINPKSLLLNLFNDEYIKSRIKQIKIKNIKNI